MSQLDDLVHPHLLEDGPELSTAEIRRVRLRRPSIRVRLTANGLSEVNDENP